MLGKKMDVMVSISMLVYNHEKWLDKAIQSVLMQKTNFRYELLIAEDCSTDGSREIVINYQKKYPDIIRATLNSVNLGMYRNGRQNQMNAKGKYYAILEGDDYWTDPNKLQIQIDFLETHLEYSGCYHSVQYVDENERPIDIDTTDLFDEDSDVDKDIWPSLPLPGQTGSIVMRNYYRMLSKDVMNIYWTCGCNGDMKIPILMLKYGKIRRIGRTMSCYRRTYTGDSFNARIKSIDVRPLYYLQNLERDRLAALFWNKKYFPNYNDCMFYIDYLLKDKQQGKRDVDKHLVDMASYDVFQFLFFLFVLDMRSIKYWEPIRLVRENEMEYLRQRRYIIFGTGEYGEKCYELLSSLKAKITCAWDNDGKKKIFHEINVVRPCEGEQGNMIVISTRKYEKEVRMQLNSLGYKENVDFITFNGLIKEGYVGTLMQKYPHVFPK